MTLLAFFTLCAELRTAITAAKASSTRAESDEEAEILATRLKKACDDLDAARCEGTSTNDLREARRLIEETVGV